jgi:hypothetical protein
MNLRFVGTLGGKQYYVGDEDDDAPMVKLEFCNEFFTKVPADRRREIAVDALTLAAKACQKVLEE